MGRHANLPFHLYVNVDNRLLGPKMPSGVTPAIWHAVHCRPNQALMCHVLLESGAHWSGLPIHGISNSTDFSAGHDELMPWAAMGDAIECFHVRYLEGLECDTLLPTKRKGRHTGIMIDWSDGFSRYAEEHKPLNLLSLETGQFALLPNNYVLYRDAHFVEEKAKENLKYYLRGNRVYWGS